LRSAWTCMHKGQGRLERHRRDFPYKFWRTCDWSWDGGVSLFRARESGQRVRPGKQATWHTNRYSFI